MSVEDAQRMMLLSMRLERAIIMHDRLRRRLTLDNSAHEARHHAAANTARGDSRGGGRGCKKGLIQKEGIRYHKRV